MSITSTYAYQQLRPCIDAYGHRFKTEWPPYGTWGYSITTCERCGLTPEQARAY